MSCTKSLFIFSLFGLGMIFLQKTNAEYRVYQYIVRDKAALAPGQIKTIKSTLPPQSFQAYRGGAGQIEAELLRTWHCKGHTGARRPLCPSPAEKPQLRVDYEN